MNQESTEAATRTGSKITAIALLTIGCLSFLVAHYLLGEWAESSLMAHDLQHIVIFAAGITSGAASYKLLRNK